MQYWLMKSEPETWSWEQQVKAGAKGEGWDGVRNYQASNNMKKMKKGDLCFFYHSVKERDIVGIVKVVKEYHPDPTDKSKRFGMVSVSAVKAIKKRVNLETRTVCFNDEKIFNIPKNVDSETTVKKINWFSPIRK